MSRHKILYILPLFVLTACEFTLKEVVLDSQTIKPDINYQVNVLTQTKDGFTLLTETDYFSDLTPKTGCLMPLKQENLLVEINNEGKITDQKKIDLTTQFNNPFYDGQQYIVTSENRILSLRYLDINFKETYSASFNLLLKLPAQSVLSENSKVFFVSSTEYYFYGALTNKDDKNERVYFAHIKNKTLVDLFVSEDAFNQEFEILKPMLNPDDNKLYFIVSPKAFGNKALYSLSLNSGVFTYCSEINTNKLNLDGPIIKSGSDLLMFLTPNLVYVYNTNSQKLTPTDLPLNPSKFANTGLKFYSINKENYIGYKSVTGESAVYLMNKDKSFTKLFKVANVDLTYLIEKNSKPVLIEFDNPKQEGTLVQSKIKIHSGPSAFTEKVLFEGIGYRKLCGGK